MNPLWVLLCSVTVVLGASTYSQITPFNPGSDIRCPSGQVRQVDGSCVNAQVTRNLFLFDAPPLPYQQPAARGPLPTPKLRYNIVFIRTPEEQGQLDPIVIPPTQEQTLVYVLNKNKVLEQQTIVVPDQPVNSPEVYYVNYNEGENVNLPGGYDLNSALSLAQSSQGQLIENQGTQTLDPRFESTAPINGGQAFPPTNGGSYISTGGGSSFGQPTAPISSPESIVNGASTGFSGELPGAVFIDTGNGIGSAGLNGISTNGFQSGGGASSNGFQPALAPISNNIQPNGGSSSSGFQPNGGSSSNGFQPNGGSSSNGFQPNGGSSSNGLQVTGGASPNGFQPNIAPDSNNFQPTGGSSLNELQLTGGASSNGFQPALAPISNNIQPNGGISSNGFQPNGGSSSNGFQPNGGISSNGFQSNGGSSSNGFQPNGGISSNGFQNSNNQYSTPNQNFRRHR